MIGQFIILVSCVDYYLLFDSVMHTSLLEDIEPRASGDLLWGTLATVQCQSDVLFQSGVPLVEVNVNVFKIDQLHLFTRSLKSQVQERDT